MTANVESTMSSAVQRRIAALEEKSPKAMKPSNKANYATTTPPRNQNLVSKPQASLAFRRSAGLAERLAPSPATTSSTAATSSLEAAQYRRNRLASPRSGTGKLIAERMKERRGLSPTQKPLTEASLQIPDLSTTKRTNTSAFAVPVATSTTPSSTTSKTNGGTKQQRTTTPGKKRLGELVAERMQQKSSPAARQSPQRYTTQRPSALSSPKATRRSAVVSPTSSPPTSTSPLHSRPYRPMSKSPRTPSSPKTLTSSPQSYSPRHQQSPHSNKSLGSIAQERIRERRRTLGSRMATYMQQQQQSPRNTAEPTTVPKKTQQVLSQLRDQRQQRQQQTNSTPPSRLVRQALERKRDKRHVNDAFDPFGASSEEMPVFSEPDEDDEMTLTNVRQIVETARVAATEQQQPQVVWNSSSNASSAPYRPAKDDDTYYDDDGDDEDSQGSVSYAERQRRKERELRRKAAAEAAAKVEGPFLVKDDVEHYRRAVDTPLSRTVVGIAVAATTGCLVLGPVGLLVGAAAVGIGVGYMQIPEEERSNMNLKASEVLHNFRDSALSASDNLSHSCAKTYHNSGVADHVPLEVQNCCSSFAADIEQVTNFRDDDISVKASSDIEEEDAPRTPPPSRNTSTNKRTKVACLRTAKVVPITQIYALDPSKQPKAWLDVLASADTTLEDKIEATEEIIILAKDKQKCRVFVNEGILDCLLWTIGRYLEKKRGGPGSEYWAHPNVSSLEASSAKVTSICCLTLGKSYCAAIHTEGDLQLMSLYERGSVPEERQLAQMLLEVPHHARATRKGDPTIIANETFVLRQLNLGQAEELAAAIVAIASGDL